MRHLHVGVCQMVLSPVLSCIVERKRAATVTPGPPARAPGAAGGGMLAGRTGRRIFT